MLLENWINIYDQLDEIVKNDNNLKKSKSFDMDNGRITVKVRWVKTSDSSEMGTHVLKILNLSSTNVGKYFLKVDVKLNSNFQKLVTELEDKIKLLEGKNSISVPCEVVQNHVKPRTSSVKINEIFPKINDIFPKIHKEKLDSSSLPLNTSDYNGFEDIENVEEYIPVPVPAQTTSTSFPTETPPAYHPQKSYAEIEINKIKSEYSPTYINPEKPIEEIASYKPSARRNRSSERDGSKRSSTKKNRIREKSEELFGATDEDDDDLVDKVSSSSSQHKSKRRKETPRKEWKSNKETSKSKKKDVIDSRNSQDLSQDAGDISIR